VKDQVIEIIDEELTLLRSKMSDLPTDNIEPNQELYFIVREMTALQNIRKRVEDEV